MWENFLPGKRIPIFISLPVLGSMIEKENNQKLKCYFEKILGCK